MPTAIRRRRRMQIGCMKIRWSVAFANLIMSGGPNFTRPGTDAPIGPADCSPEGWPNAADFNVGLFGGSGFGLPVDPLVTGRILIEFEGECTGGVNIAGNANDPVTAYDPANDRTTGSFVVTPNGDNYVRLEFRGASFRDTDGTQKPGVRNIKVLRPRHAGSLTENYDGTEGFTDEFLNYFSRFDFFRYYQAGSGAKEWADRTPPYWWNQGSGKGQGPSYEMMIALANRAQRGIMTCFPPGISEDYMRRLVRLILFGSDATGTPYAGLVSNPVYPPLDPDLYIMLEGGLEPWNFGIPYIFDMLNYGRQVIAHHDADDEVWAAINYDNTNTTGFPNTTSIEHNEGMGYLIQRLRVYQLHRFAAIVREIDPSALHSRIRLLYSPQLTGMADALRWHENWFQRLDPRSTYSGPILTVADDITAAGGQAYWSYADEFGLTNLVASPSFATPDVGSGYSLRPAGGPFSFTGTAGIATTGSDVPQAYSGDQVGYVCGGGSASFQWTVPAGGDVGFWAILIKALGRSGDPNGGRFKVFLDKGTPNERDITPQSGSQRGGVVTPRLYGQTMTEAPESWPALRVNYTDSKYYDSSVLENLVPGATHTVTIVGVGTVDDCVFLGEVRVAWSETLTASDYPVANNTTAQWFAAQSLDANHAKMFGVFFGHYEAALSIGGDDHGNDLQQRTRYLSPGVKVGQLGVFQIQTNFECDYYAVGDFSPVPDFSDEYGVQGYINPDDFVIIQAVTEARQGQGLTPVPYGKAIPGTVNFDDQVWSDRSAPTARYLNRYGQLIDWRVLVNSPGIYRFAVSQIQFDQGSLSHLLLDGKKIATGAASYQIDVPVGAGSHSLRIQLVSGSMGEQSVTATRIADLPDPAPATSYSLSVGASRAVGTPIQVTAVMVGDPLDVDTVVTLACPKATVAGPITILSGESSGVGSITPTEAGATSLTSTNGGGLSNPPPLGLTFTSGGGGEPDPQPVVKRVFLYIN